MIRVRSKKHFDRSFYIYLNNLILWHYIPSKTMRDYLRTDEYLSTYTRCKEKQWNSYPNWSVFQLGTLAVSYIPKRKCVRFLHSLIGSINDANERALFKSAIKDLSRNKYRNWMTFSRKTMDIFKRCFKENFSAGLFEEILFWPCLFRRGDVVRYRDKNKRSKSEYYMVVASPNYEKGLMMDYTDEAYYVLSLEGGADLLDDETQGFWHNHITPDLLESVLDCSIPGKYRNIVEKLRIKLSSVENKPMQLEPSAVHTKEEMRQRWKDRQKELSIGCSSQKKDEDD